MRFQMSVTKEMAQALRDDAKKRKLATMQETMRAILGEYFMLRKEPKEKHVEEKKPTRRIESSNPLAH